MSNNNSNNNNESSEKSLVNWLNANGCFDKKSIHEKIKDETQKARVEQARNLQDANNLCND